MVILLIVSLIANIAAAIIINKALKRQDIYEQNEQVYITFNKQLEQQLRTTVEEMRKIDIRGSFESDDEVGSVFVQMKAMVEALEVFRLEQESDEDAER